MIKPHLPIALFLLAAACGTDDKGAGDTGAPADKFSEVITLDAESSGNLSCFTPGADWQVETPEPSCQVSAPIRGTVLDFEDEYGVADATVELFYSDTFAGAPDATMVTDSEGVAEGAEAPTCTPITYRVSTDPDLDASKFTIEAHQIFAPLSGDEAAIDAEFNSVSSDTYNIIPALLGISVDPEMGVIAGTAYDCDGEPMEGVQVIARGEDGSYPEDHEVRYFVDSFPARDQPTTSADGLWIAINVPPGRVTVEMWAIQSGELVQIGATELDVFADSINISNIKIGYGSGVFYPEDCLSACD